MKHELRICSQPAAIEERADKSTRIVGYGAVYYDGTDGTQFRLWDDMLERIMPGAFDRAIKEDDVRGLFNHDPSMVLGRSKAGTMALASDERGLRYEIIPGDTSVARDVREHLKRGDVTGSSFAFTVTDEQYRKEDGIHIREIHGVRLYDVGPVTFPAYEGTTAGARMRGADEDELRRHVAAQIAKLNDMPNRRAVSIRLQEVLTRTI